MIHRFGLAWFASVMIGISTLNITMILSSDLHPGWVYPHVGCLLWFTGTAVVTYVDAVKDL